MLSTYFIGVDQGSSKTQAVVCKSDGQLLTIGTAPGGYHYRDGLDYQLQTIKEAVYSAIENLHGISFPVAGIFAGLTGVDFQDDQQMLLDGVKTLDLATQVGVVGDMDIAFRCGTSKRYGAILIAGTGANCSIFSPTGEQFAYNFYVETEIQGGRALGRSALTAVYKAATGRASQTQLIKAILDFYSLRDIDSLLRLDVLGSLPARIDKLAPLIFNACDEGDEVACQIISQFSSDLASLVTAGVKRFNMETKPIDVVISGSIFKTRCPLFYDVLLQEIQKEVPAANIIQSRFEPVVGAVMRALERSGICIQGEIFQNIESSSCRLGLERL